MDSSRRLSTISAAEVESTDPPLESRDQILAKRQRLAQLLGQLLARHWLRSHGAAIKKE
jgi:hypothetical protein